MQERLWEKDRSRKTAIKRMLMLMPLLMQERLRQQAIKEKEKERQQFYQKQKEGQKDVRAKYREKVLPPSPSYHCHPYSVLLEMKLF